MATDVLWQYQDGPEIQVEFFCQALCKKSTNLHFTIWDNFMEHISILHHTNASSSQSKLQHAQNARAWKGAHSTPQGKLTPPLQKSTMMSPGRASSRTAVTRFSSCWHLRSTRLAGTSPDDTETQHYHDCSIFQLPPPACLSDTLADTVTKALLSLWFSAVDVVCVSLFVWYLSCWQAVTAIFRFFSCSHAQLGWYRSCWQRNQVTYHILQNWKKYMKSNWNGFRYVQFTGFLPQTQC